MTMTPKVALTALVLLAACSGQGSATPTASPSAASPAATASASAPATPSASATPAATAPSSPPPPPSRPTVPPVAPSPCPPGQDGQVGDGVIATADLDGDGQDDTLGTDAGAGTTGLNVRLATGGTRSVAIGPNAPAEGLANSPRVLGTADADGDGRDEVFLQLASGLAEPATIVRLVQLVDCELVVAANLQGEPYDFLVGTRTLDPELQPPAYELLGVGCVDADADGRQDLVGLSTQQTGSQVDWTRTIVTLEGGGAKNGAVDRGTYTSPDDDAAIALLDQVTCGQVTFPSAG